MNGLVVGRSRGEAIIRAFHAHGTPTVPAFSPTGASAAVTVLKLLDAPSTLALHAQS